MSERTGSVFDFLSRLSRIGAMTEAMGSATSAEEMYREALQAIADVTSAARASVLLFDVDGVMRFKAWRGLSDRYRAAVEGHTPWSPGQPSPDPVLVSDVQLDESLAAYREVFRAESIGALAMIPLVTGGGVIGKFMVYQPEVYTFSELELQLVRNIAAHTAFALDRQRAVEAFQSNERRLRDVLDRLTEVVFQSDATGRIEFLSSAWEGISGYAVRDSMGKMFLDYFHPEDAVVERERAAKLVRGEADSCEHQMRLLRKDGATRWVEVRCSLILAADGRASGTSGTLTDVTERRASAAALREAEVRLRESQRLESLGLLAGGIAHDFNNLLMGVLGNASLALEDLAEGPSDVRSSLEEITTSARHAADLTKQLLAYSGRGRFVIEPLDLAALLRHAAPLVATAASRKAKIEYHLADRLPLIKGDAIQLRQVLLNLVTNASDALEGAPGTIVIRARSEAFGRAELDEVVGGADLAPGRYVVLEVEDSGRGMDEATRAHALDPFFTTKPNGHGLGLAAALGIARGHKGGVRLRSRVGAGTTVTVIFTVEDAVEGQAETASSPAPARERTILIVDDEPVVRRVAAGMVQRLGYRTLLASNGREALEVLAQHHEEVDLVLLDLSMPELNGIETRARIRAQWPNLVVILSSGFTSDAIDAEFDAPEMLQKPYSLSDMRAAIERALVRS